MTIRFVLRECTMYYSQLHLLLYLISDITDSTHAYLKQAHFVYSTVPQTHQIYTPPKDCFYKLWKCKTSVLITSQERCWTSCQQYRAMPLSNKVLVFYWILALGPFKGLLFLINHMLLKSYCGAVFALAYLIIYDSMILNVHCNVIYIMLIWSHGNPVLIDSDSAVKRTRFVY